MMEYCTGIECTIFKRMFNKMKCTQYNTVAGKEGREIHRMKL